MLISIHNPKALTLNLDAQPLHHTISFINQELTLSLIITNSNLTAKSY